ncbi:hypothetical protein [Rhodococcus opacus]|uniref:hypothetical protein n=1 Tax=Rhodococcus opacus TaxID=37919 RepID=UPI00155A1765|nr:hypothetical protein [Rhodococcus opacus]
MTVTTGLGAGYPLTAIPAEVLEFSFAFLFAAQFLITTVVVVWRVVSHGPDEQAPRRTFDVLQELLAGTGLATLLVAVSERPRRAGLRHKQRNLRRCSGFPHRVAA